jgi:hypothetical protein
VRERRRIVMAHADTRSHLKMDQARSYGQIGREFASHESLDHSREDGCAATLTPTPLKPQD